MKRRPDIMKFAMHAFGKLAGFSLMELLVVVAIIAILAVVTVPSLPSLMGAKGVSRAVTDISSVFELARSEAVGRSAFVFLGFEEGTNSSGASELRVAAAASPDGSSTNGLLTISRMVRLPNVRLVSYNDLPAVVRNADTNNLAASRFVNEITSSSPTFTNSQQVFQGSMLVISPEGELLVAPGNAAFLPRASVGLVQTRGTTPSTNDGAIVSFDGGSGAITIVRP